MPAWPRLHHRQALLPGFLATTLFALTLAAIYGSLATLRPIQDLEEKLASEAPLVLWAHAGSGVKLSGAELEAVAKQSSSVAAYAPVTSEVLWVAGVEEQGGGTSSVRPPLFMPERAVRATVEWTTPAYESTARLRLRAGMPLPQGGVGGGVVAAGQAKATPILVSQSFARWLFGPLPPAQWLDRAVVFSRGTVNVGGHITYRGAQPSVMPSTTLFGLSDLRRPYQVVGVFEGSEVSRLVGAEPQIIAPLADYLDTIGRFKEPSLKLSARVVPGRVEQAARELGRYADLALRPAGRPGVAARYGGERDGEQASHGRNGSGSASAYVQVAQEGRYLAAIQTLRRQAAQVRLRLLVSVLVAMLGMVAVVWTWWGRRIWELGLRRALGAGRGHLFYQGVAELAGLGLVALVPGLAAGVLLRRVLLEAVAFSLAGPAAGSSAASVGGGLAASTEVGAMVLAAAALTFGSVCLVTLVCIWVATRPAPAQALQEGRLLE